MANGKMKFTVGELCYLLLGGHEFISRFEGKKMFLECIHCLKQTKGVVV